MMQVFVVRSNDGRCYHDDWPTAVVHLRQQIEKHGMATVWTRLMAEESFFNLPPWEEVAKDARYIHRRQEEQR